MRVALITGANSGFGLLAALELVKQDYQVIATMRNLQNQQQLCEEAEKLGLRNRIEIQQLDVTNLAEIQKVQQEILHTYGKLDVLINNAGYCQGGFVADLTIDQWQNQFDVNVHGVLRVTTEMLSLLRMSADRANIINISSVSGYFGFPGMSPYCSSKFALEGFSESLRLELLQENIFVSLIEPASYQTKIWEKGLASIEIDQMKEDKLKESVLTYAKKSAQSGADPIEVAQLIARICEKRKPKFRYPIGKGAKVLSLAKRLLPWGLVEKVVIRNL
ncbi:SDR family oxidoreductase [Gracilibacillus oryzae]|uniref:SDR family oxidoreductase n=1 Tax=Gracilibacillus oryzae TaxID=1672701 RepID=A0A7C8KNU6_9BACI|nr:SDR family oxidoreductase [Gracilibacillus oryzae]KAB8129184.1 SDR family oxidoreductase [Gracilibacillus oryzae]